MFEWTPPPRSIAVLSIDAFDGPYHESLAAPGRMTVTQCDVALADFLDRFRLKRSESFIKIPVDDPRLVDVLSALAESRDKRMLRLKAGWIEEPSPRASDSHAWFELSTGPTEFKSPRRASAGSHFAWRDGQHVASEAFRCAVRDAGLTGLAWLPLEDACADDPVQWHEVYAEHPIGRGLDHPLVDRGKLDASKLKYGFDMMRRWGEPIAWFKHLRDEVVIRSEGAIALATPTTANFRVAGPYRFVREYLPHTDFAYRGWGFARDKGPGHKGRPVRSISCNARARAGLIESGVMKPTRFRPLATVADRDAGAEILDRVISGPIPPPVYTHEEALVELAKRERSLASRVRSASSISFDDLGAAIEHLSRRLREGSLPWIPSGNTAAFDKTRASELFARTPTAWQRLTPYLPLEFSVIDPDDGNTFDFVLQPPEWNEWLAYAPGERPPDEEPSAEDLVIARTPYGDWYAFRKTDPLLPHDARIVRWDHETMQIGEEWASVAALVALLLDLGLRAQRP